VGVKDESAPGSSGSRTAKQPREEAFVRSEEVSKPSRKESVGNLAEVHKPLAEDHKPGTSPDLTEIDREGRERKATKADDAEVPEYLWHEHIFEDCGRI
jgi:hypothetical protein